ncbi:MAG TPA: 4-hydroxy-3-methylbut-2-en-1-yl diphosphate synthase [Flavobacteriales bacterium]|nr:4-hydroxy-3-methylbut-2-en-1-yl diphosphate synthase [Flavobacteriales bacterium]
MPNPKYCNSLISYSRFQTREVKVGQIGIGGNNPIRVQSMTTTDTMDTEATVAQSIRMIDAGCELVRITAPSIKEAHNLANIKAGLVAKGYNTPICADIHFTPNAAEFAATIVEKVRVNPGNYADKKKFETIDYTDESYQAELTRIRERFIPLIEICKKHGTAMRIGTNHGSLSDRILSRYGDTPLGMVESAMEFLRICREFDFHDIVLSMKASNTQVMVQAYRLLVSTMMENGMDYPLHLGVTEAGEGEDGRIKSAVGIGTLLEDGLGDTVRVSLTEDPEFEIPVAQALVARYETRSSSKEIQAYDSYPINPFQFHKRKTDEALNFGGENVPRVVADLSSKDEIVPANLFAFGYNYSTQLDKWNLTDLACDFLYIGDKQLDFNIPGTLGIIQNADSWNSTKDRHYPLFDAQSFSNESPRSEVLNFVQLRIEGLTDDFISVLKKDKTIVLVLKSDNENALAELRRAVVLLIDAALKIPVIFKREYVLDENAFQLYSATDLGGLLVDGLGDGCWITGSNVPNKILNSTSFGILQAARARTSKTEYISCPSCGRTLFDLQETTAKIRNRTDHLKGVKIGIMGCIVNGPGEMADADYGYVGTGKGKITLYKGQEVVRRNIASEGALEALEGLIKEHGDWVERPNVEA